MRAVGDLIYAAYGALEHPAFPTHFVATPSPSPSQTPETPLDTTWRFILALAAIVSLVAGVQQLLWWFSRRKQRRAEERVLHLAAQQLHAEAVREDTESVERDNERLRQLRTSLLVQIREELPAEARRIYLENRLDHLSTTLASDYHEYLAIERRLGELNPSSQLDRSIRSAIESIVVPAAHARRRRERIILSLLVIVAITSFSPLNPGALLLLLWRSLAKSDMTSGPLLFALLILGATISTALVYAVQSVIRSTRIYTRLRPRTKRSRLLVGSGFILTAACLVALGLTYRDFAIGAHNTTCETYFDDTIRCISYVDGQGLEYRRHALSSLVAGVAVAGIGVHHLVTLRQLPSDPPIH